MAETADDRAERLSAALRATQIVDEAIFLGAARWSLTRLQDALGEELTLACTGAAEGEGFYNHDGDTCPIHEWLSDDDHVTATVARQLVTVQ